MISYKKFVEENNSDLKRMFDILKHRVETRISYNSFCKFCYEYSL